MPPSILRPPHLSTSGRKCKPSLRAAESATATPCSCHPPAKAAKPPRPSKPAKKSLQVCILRESTAVTSAGDNTPTEAHHSQQLHFAQHTHQNDRFKYRKLRTRQR